MRDGQIPTRCYQRLLTPETHHREDSRAGNSACPTKSAGPDGTKQANATGGGLPGREQEKCRTGQSEIGDEPRAISIDDLLRQTDSKIPTITLAVKTIGQPLTFLPLVLPATLNTSVITPSPKASTAPRLTSLLAAIVTGRPATRRGTGGSTAAAWTARSRPRPSGLARWILGPAKNLIDTQWQK